MQKMEEGGCQKFRSEEIKKRSAILVCAFHFLPWPQLPNNPVSNGATSSLRCLLDACVFLLFQENATRT